MGGMFFVLLISVFDKNDVDFRVVIRENFDFFAAVAVYSPRASIFALVLPMEHIGMKQLFSTRPECKFCSQTDQKKKFCKIVFLLPTPPDMESFTFSSTHVVVCTNKYWLAVYEIAVSCTPKLLEKTRSVKLIGARFWVKLKGENVN